MKTTNRPSDCKVAIIGAGLAGLSAAYHLREALGQSIRITILEKEKRIGGRVFTSHDPPGEHGAEFLLRSEKRFTRIVKNELRLKLNTVGWPWYQWDRKYAWGHPSKAVRKLLPTESAQLVIDLFNRSEPAINGSFRHWLSSVLRGDREAIRFVEMLLISETCAPLDHVSARHGYGCLWSLLKDEWYRIHGGSDVLVKTLRTLSKAHLELGACVKKVITVRGGARIHRKQNGQQKSDVFQAVIIATPDGERLRGKQPPSCYHSYVSVLLAYRGRPQVKDHQDVDLTKGLYTDGSLNYIQLTKGAGPPYGLRILIPNAEKMFRWEESDVVAFCVKHLKPIIADADNFYASSVKPWEFGLPCGGNSRPFEKIGNRVYLAGDRFGKWPSMDAAITSGHRTAAAVDEFLTRQAAAASTVLSIHSRYFLSEGNA